MKVSGELRAPKELEFRNEVGGIISEIGFASGAKVQKGDVLLRLDASEEQARASALVSQVRLAEKDVKRLSGIKNKQAVSQQLIDQTRNSLAVSKADLANVKESIANKTIVAPFSGTLGLHDLEVGEFIASETLITRLVGDTSELWVDFNLPQQAGSIKSGEQIEVRAPGLFEGARNGTVAVVEPAISRQTRALAVRAMLDNRDLAITPGAFVTVSAPIGEIKNIIRIPSTAVRRDAFGSFVFVLNKDEKNSLRAQRRPVTELAKDGLDSILEATLEADMVVATTGAFKLREGLLVKLAEQEPSAEQEPLVNTSSISNSSDLVDDVPFETDAQQTQDDQLISTEELLINDVLNSKQTNEQEANQEGDARD